MRLLNARTLEFEEFVGEGIPPYAILSHTWGAEEVSYKDHVEKTSSSKLGYEKMVQCCRLADAEGFGYAWIDTCCINKSSSAELTEAINSMMRWYRDAAICYAYLSDVDSTEDPTAEGSSFTRSRWFTRGWTLQELLAPAEVVFLGAGWREIGTKKSLRAAVSRITGIAEGALDERTWSGYSVAEKMSWAAGRQTTRPEDEAYCLMGLFDVNMPMLYGEGRNAFYRLQQEILKQSNDQSIFAWCYPEDKHSHTRMSGLLSPSPEYFRQASGIRLLSHDDEEEVETPFELVHQMIRIRKPVCRSVEAMCLQRLPGKMAVFNATEVRIRGTDNANSNTEDSALQRQDSGLEDGAGVHEDEKQDAKLPMPVATMVLEDTPADEPVDESTEASIAEDSEATLEADAGEETALAGFLAEADDGSPDHDPQLDGPLDPARWHWYIYQPVMIVPLMCLAGRHRLGILLSRAVVDRADGHALFRLHKPSLVAIDELPASHFQFRQITAYATTPTPRARPDALPLPSWGGPACIEARFAPLISAGYALHPGSTLEEESDQSQIFLWCKPEDIIPSSRNRPDARELALFYNDPGNGALPSVFVVHMSTRLSGLFCKVGVVKAAPPSLALECYEAELERPRHAKVPLGNGQAVVLRYRQGVDCNYVVLSVDSLEGSSAPLAAQLLDGFIDQQTYWECRSLFGLLGTRKSEVDRPPWLV